MLLDRAIVRLLPAVPRPLVQKLSSRYIAGMAIISWLGQYDGRGTIPFWWDIVVVAAFSLVIYTIALHVRLRPERTQALIGDLTAEAEQEERALGAAATH